MNEGTKTAVFWGVAVVTLAIAALVAWRPTSEPDDQVAGTNLFEDFKDPLAAASMKIVTFDEEKGTLETFEVRKDRETGLWTIPSRGGYPADAVEQMTEAANSLVGLKILDEQTRNAEDHDDLGVAEPKLEDLQIGDEGVGRLVTFKDESQNTLASLIIGDETKDDPEQRYVRIPGQDPVYVVKLDESPLTTNFQDWIEEDLLQLSSIDIEDIEIKDYNASMNLGGQISLDRNYVAKVSHDGTDWELASLAEYDSQNPLAPPTPVDPPEGQELNTSKLNDMKNALDDLEIADVGRKPEGMSATLRANQDLLTDNEAVSSLAQRGFYPIQRGSDYEILSANGEMTVGVKDGVEYVMRFGNISGVSEAAGGDESEETAGGVNRYLLVMAQLNESKIPVPDLQQVPETLDDLKAMLEPQPEPAPEVDAGADSQPDGDTPPGNGDAADSDKDTGSGNAEAADDDSSDEASTSEPAESTEPQSDAAVSEVPSEPESASAPEGGEVDENQPQGETEASGQGEVSGSGQALQQESGQADSEDAQPDSAEDEPDSPAEPAAAAEDASDDDEPADAVTADGDANDDEAASQTSAAADQNADADNADGQPAAAAESEWDSMTPEERQERLEAEQEKITKENQRKLDERKDKLEAAKRRVRELNERFADWYYVIAEDTYAKLRIDRDELFVAPDANDDAATPGMNIPGSQGPSFPMNFPGAPGN